MIELSPVQAWLLLTAAILAGGGCYSVGIIIGSRMARRVINRAYAVGDDDARWPDRPKLWARKTEGWVSEKRGYEVAEEAYAAFDRWLAEQSDEVQELGLLEQIEIHAQANQP